MQSASASPTWTGFRFILRRPALTLAEISWRWSVGFAAAILLGLGFAEYLNTLPVTSRDMLFLRTGQTPLISQAIEHILQGSAPRALLAFAVIVSAMALAWIFTAALGRGLTLRAVENGLREENDFDSPGRQGKFGSLAALNFFRVASVLAALAGTFGAIVLASLASPEDAPGLGVLIFLAAMLFVWLAWSAVNWVLSFAAIFVVVRGENAFGAIAAALRLSTARFRAVFVTSFWFWLAHGVGFVAAGFAAFLPLAFAGLLPRGVVLFGLLLVTLIYFALADFLYMGRLAAYVAIVEGPERPRVELEPPMDLLPPDIRSCERVDREEVILSDLPLAGLS